jgi:hypothetical protein
MAYSVTTDKSWARIVDDIEESFRKWGQVAPGWRVATLLAPRSAWNMAVPALVIIRKGATQ